MAQDFIGVPYPIVKDARGYFHSQKGLRQIKSDLLILLLTDPGERCLTGDTKIPLADGTESTIKELVDKEPFWIYSFDIENNIVVPGKATAHKTVENAELLEVILDNKEAVRCTPNHLWLLRDGTYCRADELQTGCSLMPLYRNFNTSGYERVYQPNIQNYRETHLCFVFEKRLAGIREVVHHKDLNKLNNSPDNLQWMTCKDHKQLHKEINNAFILKMQSDPVFKEGWIAKVKKGLKEYYETHDGHRKGAVLSDETKKKLSDSKHAFYETEEGMELREILRQKALKQFENGSHMLGRKHTEEAKQKMRKPKPSMLGENNPSKKPEVREKLRLAWIKRREFKNHKVIEIRKLDHKEDCYDLHVEKYHNFGLSSGVFVHNCMLPQFGTGLKKLLFEPNDADLASTARQLIINAITNWEPRVSVEQIDISTNLEGSLDPNDDGNQNGNILMIRISFVDQQDIQTVQELRLSLPIGGS